MMNWVSLVFEITPMEKFLKGSFFYPPGFSSSFTFFSTPHILLHFLVFSTGSLVYPWFERCKYYEEIVSNMRLEDSNMKLWKEVSTDHLFPSNFWPSWWLSRLCNGSFDMTKSPSKYKCFLCELTQLPCRVVEVAVVWLPTPPHKSSGLDFPDHRCPLVPQIWNYLFIFPHLFTKILKYLQ